jgi:hypothetical protein
MSLRQCKSCPWRKATVASVDIPNGYCATKHERLRNTLGTQIGEQLRIMACHKSDVGEESPCVGWLHNQLGPGNNIALRLVVLTSHRDWAKYKLLGEQVSDFEETLR